MLKGINAQKIFEDNEDNEVFINKLKAYKEICEYELYAYCLMGNHVHFLIKTGKEDLGLILKRIAGSYVYWYNLKYRRTGHLFQDRFRSEPVEDEGYFLTVLRYIHRNPVVARLVSGVSEYSFSSYNEYMKPHSTLVDVNFALSIVGKDEFIRYHLKEDKATCLDINDMKPKLNDEDAKAIMQKISKCSNAAEFQMLNTANRDKYLAKLKEEGLSIRQITRITGISFSTVRRI
jgi:REP element-mobilizing transposase RayT